MYESGGEIIYFKRLGNGTLSSPVMLSKFQDTLIGRNGMPSITRSGSTLHVVWQKKRYGHDVYDIVHRYSTNGGSSWSSEVYAAEGLTQSWDPIPAVAASVMSWSPHLMLTYRGPDGLHALVYNFSANQFGPYTSGNSLVLADTLAASPALTASWYGGNTKQHIAWSGNSSAIYYSMFTASSSSWSTPVNLSSIVSGTASHLTPSISGNINGNIHMVWHRSTGSGQYSNVIYHRRKHSSNGTWPNQYAATFNGCQGNPTISSVSSTDAKMAWSYPCPTASSTYKQTYNSNGTWSTPTLLSTNSHHPSVSLYNETRAVWTAGTSSPYSIEVSSSVLKELPAEQAQYVRALSWRGQDMRGSVELRLVEPVLTVADQQYGLPWAAIHPDSSISLFNLGVYLQPELSGIDDNLLADGRVSFALQLLAEEPEDLGGIELDVMRGSERLHTQWMMPHAERGEAVYTFELAAGTVSKGMPVHIRPHIARDSDLALGHLYIEAGGWERLAGDIAEKMQVIQGDAAALPDKITAGVYPNPFNPQTVIRFQLPAESRVRLTVYDILGRRVEVLAYGTFSAGAHEAVFNAANLSSGVYLYRLESPTQALTGKMLLMK